MQYSKLTKKGQVTIPSKLRKRYGLQEGATVGFEESKDGIIVKPTPDIMHSAGRLSRYARAEDVLDDLIRTRKKEFR
ncbi:MAG: AbrB/MazE/SpoVT family DNA-binding domain-containing protein [Nitrososphaerales archaeon]